MKVLLVGSGGREHALGWKLAQSQRVTELISLPGNPGLADLGPTVEGISPTDVGAVAAMARIQGVDLVVVGPEGTTSSWRSGRIARPRDSNVSVRPELPHDLRLRSLTPKR